MSSYRRIRFKNPPAWTQGHASRAGLSGFGQDDMEMSNGGGDFPSMDSLTSFFDTSTPVSEVVVTAGQSPVDVTPYEPLLSPPIELQPNAPIYDPLTDPTWTFSPASPVFTPLGTNPVTKALQSLFGPKKPAAGGGGGGSSISAPPKPKAPTAPAAKPAAAAGLTATPQLAAGLALALAVFAMAALAGHHKRHGGG